MSTMIATPSPRSAGYWESIKQHAYGYREVAIATLVFGIYLHLTRLVFGDELLLRYLLTPTVDRIFSIPMTYAAITGLVGWRRLVFRGRAHRIASIVVLGIFVLSVPLHILSYFGNSMARFAAFPMWYSFAEAAVLYPAFIVALWRIQFSQQ